MNPTPIKRLSFEDAAEKAISQRDVPEKDHVDLRSSFPAHENLYDPPLRVLEFEHVIVNRHGFIKLKDGSIVTDIGYRHYADPSAEHLHGLSFEDSSIPLIEDPVILVGGHNNYYHWHLNWMPRVTLADRFPALRSFKLLTHENPASYVINSLEKTTNRTREDMVQLKGPPRRAKRIFVPTFFMNPIHAPFVLDAYDHLRKKPDNGEGRRIYISRSKAPLRRVINDDEVAAMLESDYGFECLNAEDLSYDEQVALFKNASVIISAHGAGLTNMIFASPGFSVIELMNDYYTKVYWSLCMALGGRHYRQIASKDCHLDSNEPDETQARKNADFVVDLEALRREVEFVIQTAE
ncbi:MAG: hypothetical protein CMK09_06835 [Ponticaulis sp.]|nr:hypothetical protein [Ponticaulis sp.]|tara:strand:+ start:12430 stop:13482 length:1053 start_codon:yes stop_codon:yes gene_type:complete